MKESVSGVLASLAELALWTVLKYLSGVLLHVWPKVRFLQDGENLGMVEMVHANVRVPDEHFLARLGDDDGWGAIWSRLNPQSMFEGHVVNGLGEFFECQVHLLCAHPRFECARHRALDVV